MDHAEYAPPPTQAASRFKRRLRGALFVGCVFVLLALVAKWATLRGANRGEIARQTQLRDGLKATADEAEAGRQRAQQDKETILRVLAQARTAADLPRLGGSRIASCQEDVDRLCLYVPAGSHTLKIATRWGPRPPKPGRPDQPDSSDEVKSWSVPLRPERGYLFRVVRDKKTPLSWELTCNDPEFASQTEIVLDEPIYDRGYSWSGTEVLQFPNQLAYFTVYKSGNALQTPPGVRVMNGTFEALYEEQPYQLTFEAHLYSEAPPCISAHDVQSLITVGREHLVGPYAGEGRYLLRLPNDKRQSPAADTAR